MELCGAESYNALKQNLKMLVEEFVIAGKQLRDEKWTKSVAVGSQDYIHNIKDQLGYSVSGRMVRQRAETTYHLREPQASYNVLLGGKNDDIEYENGYFWDSYD